MENHQFTKEDIKRGRKEQRKNETTRKPENNEQDGNSKFLLIKNCFKCKWIKLSNQKIKSLAECIKHAVHLYAAYKRISLDTKAQNRL